MEVVAALEHGDDAAAGRLLGERRAQRARHRARSPAAVTAMPPSGSRRSESKPAEMSTNSGANCAAIGSDDLVERARVLGVAEAGRERQVDGATRARAAADLVGGARCPG